MLFQLVLVDLAELVLVMDHKVQGLILGLIMQLQIYMLDPEAVELDNQEIMMLPELLLRL